MLGDKALVDAVLEDYTKAPISDAEKALFAFIAKVNAESITTGPADIDALHAAGWTDEAIYDAITVCALFNFYNRWIDATGVHEMPEAAHRAGGKRLAERGYIHDEAGGRATVKPWRRIALKIGAAFAALYLAAVAGLYGIMCQPPEVFGSIMRHVPDLAFMVFPFRPLWLNARAGHLKVGDPAPDFTLGTQDKKSRVQLSSFRGLKPVVLVFGSYT